MKVIFQIVNGFLAIVGLYLIYVKDTAVDPKSKIKYALPLLICGAIAVMIESSDKLFFTKQPATKEDIEPLATRKDVSLLKEEIERFRKEFASASAISKPTQREVESEIDKEFTAEFEKKKETALKEYRKGLGALESSNFVLAIHHFGTAIEIFAIPSFYRIRGISYFLTGQFDLSISDYTEAIELNPNSADAYLDRGYAWSMKRDQDKAIDDYNRAIELDADPVEAYFKRGLSWVFKGDLDTAIDDFSKVILLDPKRIVTYFFRAFLWQLKGDRDKAMEDVNKVIRLYPNYARAYIYRGNISVEKGDWDKGIDDYSRAIQLDPNSVEAVKAYFNRAFVWQLKQDDDKATDDYKRAIQINPDYAKQYVGRLDRWAVIQADPTVKGYNNNEKQFMMLPP